MSQVTEILCPVECIEPTPTGSSQLLPLVYDELRQLAAMRMRHETPGQTLQATALVHEAYLRLAESSQIQSWNGRGHFFAAAAEAMRRILVERARRRESLKGGGRHHHVTLPEIAQSTESQLVDLIGLDDALRKLEALAPRKAELVKLRYFAGLTHADAARALGISTSTADNDWAYVKCWLRLEMQGRSVSDLEC